MSQVPPRRLPSASEPTLKPLTCSGCGAPLFPTDCQCAYCLRATGLFTAEQARALGGKLVLLRAGEVLIDATCMEDPERRYITASERIDHRRREELRLIAKPYEPSYAQDHKGRRVRIG